MKNGVSFKKKLNTQEKGGKGTFNIEGQVRSSAELRRLFKINSEKVAVNIEGNKASRDEGPNNKQFKPPIVAIESTKTKEIEQEKAKEKKQFQLQAFQNKGAGQIAPTNNHIQKNMLRHAGNSYGQVHSSHSKGGGQAPPTNSQGQKKLTMQASNISSKGSQILDLKKQPMKKVVTGSDETRESNQSTRQPMKKALVGQNNDSNEKQPKKRVVLEHSESIESPIKKTKRMSTSRSLLMSDFLEQNGEVGIEDKQDADEDEVFNIMEEREAQEQEENEEEDQEDMHENVLEKEIIDVEGTSKKRTRGPTLCLKIHARSIDEHEEVTLDGDGEPIGPSDKVVSDLSYFLGTMARNGNFCPLIYTSFKALSKEERERIWCYVNEKYIIPEIGKKAIFACINDAWRRYKNFIKRRYYLNYSNLKERLENRPKNIHDNHFRALMTYWANEEVQDVSKKNAVNRAKQKYIHRMGPTNFARIRARLRANKENGEDVSQTKMFVETRQSRKGKEVDQETQNAINKLQDSIKSSSEDVGKAFQSLFGEEKPGRVRCMGRIVTPTMLKKNDEIAALKKQHCEEVSSLSNKVKGMEALLRCILKQNNPEMDDEALDNMMENALTPGSSGSTHIPNHNEENHLGEDDNQHQDLEDEYDDDVI